MIGVSFSSSSGRLTARVQSRGQKKVLAHRLSREAYQGDKSHRKKETSYHHRQKKQAHAPSAVPRGWVEVDGRSRFQ